jgi:ABC-type multidrug transport system ATPase subunit
MTLQANLKLDLGNFLLDAKFEIPSIGVTAVFGRSGSGKTTLLRCLAGLERKASGTLRVAGQSWMEDSPKKFLAPHQRSVGFVFQEGSLLPHLTVRGNLLYAMNRSSFRKMSSPFEEVVSLLGIASLLDRRPDRLSGGERQRVSIARSLLSDPKLLLMDEPLSALDSSSRLEILPYLEKVKTQAKLPIIYVSHAVEEVRRLADRVILLEAGKVRSVGSPEDLLPNSASERTPLLVPLREGAWGRSPFTHSKPMSTLLEGLQSRGYRVGFLALNPPSTTHSLESAQVATLQIHAGRTLHYTKNIDTHLKPQHWVNEYFSEFDLVFTTSPDADARDLPTPDAVLRWIEQVRPPKKSERALI